MIIKLKNLRYNIDKFAKEIHNQHLAYKDYDMAKYKSKQIIDGIINNGLEEHCPVIFGKKELVPYEELCEKYKYINLEYWDRLVCSELRWVLYN